MKEFDTAAVAVLDEEDDGTIWTEFTVNERDADGELVRAVTCYAQRPHEGLMLITMAATGRQSSIGDKVAGAIDLLFECLDPETHNYLSRRLMNRDDPFGMEDVTNILRGLTEEWSGRPTKSPSDSAPSRKSGGRSSTRRTSTST